MARPISRTWERTRYSPFRAPRYARCGFPERTALASAVVRIRHDPRSDGQHPLGRSTRAHNIEFQDFLVMAHGFATYAEALHAVTRVHLHARLTLESRGYTVTGVADEGGWGPLLPSNETALQIVTEAIERSGYRPKEQLSIALDVAASHFESGGSYTLRTENRTFTSSEMVTLSIDGPANTRSHRLKTGSSRTTGRAGAN